MSTRGLKLDDIDLARDVLGLLIERKQKGDRSDATMAQIAEMELEVGRLIVKYHAQPDCPFCRRGKMVTTATQGRLGCEKCNAIGLVGRMEVVK